MGSSTSTSYSSKSSLKYVSTTSRSDRAVSGSNTNRMVAPPEERDVVRVEAEVVFWAGGTAAAAAGFVGIVPAALEAVEEAAAANSQRGQWPRWRDREEDSSS